MDDHAIITAWTEVLGVGETATIDLERQMALLNPSITRAILDALVTDPASPIAICASSIVIGSSPIHQDGEKHLDHNANSLLAIVPELAETYASFAINWNTDKIKVLDIFESTVDAASMHFDVPRQFVFDPDDDMHMLPYMRGFMIKVLTMSRNSDVDAEWLGEHSKELAPFSFTMYERGDSSREFCEQLLSSKAPAISAGTL